MEVQGSPLTCREYVEFLAFLSFVFPLRWENRGTSTSHWAHPSYIRFKCWSTGCRMLDSSPPHDLWISCEENSQMNGRNCVVFPRIPEASPRYLACTRRSLTLMNRVLGPRHSSQSTEYPPPGLTKKKPTQRVQRKHGYLRPGRDYNLRLNNPVVYHNPRSGITAS